ncbi:hypothetical protein [Methylobacterium soli]|uniref:Uncharacterized protein n=1 Tax=Methylobacterium soli TaxID=553447 RepID=A0A6L3SVE7_9HYPH|nr:hypothetical protein [Methylobacterium soli]KAB1077509.1 hypothetical protein F6X53_18525 [Methylobacterium soli]
MMASVGEAVLAASSRLGRGAPLSAAAADAPLATDGSARPQPSLGTPARGPETQLQDRLTEAVATALREAGYPKA